jgi:drug/metabolite transporter (DMT)-like permease
LDKYIGVIIGVGAAIFFAFNSVWNRKLKEVHFLVLMVMHGLIGFILLSILICVEALITGNGFRIYNTYEYGMLAGVSIFDCIGCYSMTIAYQSDSSGFVSLLGYGIIVWGFNADIFVF